MGVSYERGTPVRVSSSAEIISVPPTIAEVEVHHCEDRVLDGPASGRRGNKGRKSLDCIRGKGVSTTIQNGASSACPPTALESTRHIQHSQGQIMALA